MPGPLRRAIRHATHRQHCRERGAKPRSSRLCRREDGTGRGAGAANASREAPGRIVANAIGWIGDHQVGLFAVQQRRDVLGVGG